MGHRYEARGTPQQWVGIIVILVTFLFASAIPGYTRSGGGHGGGHGFHGGHGWHGHGGHGWRGWHGASVSIGVGPYWGLYGWPYGYPYAYPYPYTYPSQIYVQPSQPLTVQPPSSPPVWYYCDNPQGYYPYVQQCPGGWRTVAPSPQ
jgi:hypothetical protein